MQKVWLWDKNHRQVNFEIVKILLNLRIFEYCDMCQELDLESFALLIEINLN